MAVESDCTVSELARRSGVTVRTLHHYDEIGLVVPSRRSASGYRLYSGADTERLGHVLAYRACGLALPEIAILLEEDSGDRARHLRRQLELMDSRVTALERQRAVLVRALEAWQMGIHLDPEEVLTVFGDDDPAQYAEEAEARWGDTDAYRESRRRSGDYTKADWERMRAEQEATEAAFADLMSEGIAPDDVRAMALAERHRSHIDTWFYPCTHDMQVGLAGMYVADPRFAAHYDDRRPGLAQYVHDAIVANATAH